MLVGMTPRGTKRHCNTPTASSSKRRNVNTPCSCVSSEDEVEDVLQSKKSAAAHLDNPPRVLPPGPRSVVQMFKWPEFILRKACAQLGPVTVHELLDNLNWHVSTSFSGMGCPEIAIEMIKAHVCSLGPDFAKIGMCINYGMCLDKNRECRKVLLQNLPGRCVFKDILDFVEKGKNMKTWKLRSQCSCALHENDCDLMPSDAASGCAKVMIAGPPCTPWSKRGKRQGNNDPQAQTHLIWASFVLREKFDIVIFECVYDPEVLQNVTKFFGQCYHIEHAKVSAERLGFFVSRVRLYVIMMRKQAYTWTSNNTLQEEVDNLARSVAMTTHDAFFMTPYELKEFDGCWDTEKGMEDNLSAAELRFLEDYTKSKQSKTIYDLSQNPKFSATCELKTGVLPNLTTNCGSLFSTLAGRTLQWPELLVVQGVPATPCASSAAGVKQWLFPVSRSAKVRMAGNGMHVPSVGSIVLLAMLHAQPVGSTV